MDPDNMNQETTAVASDATGAGTGSPPMDPDNMNQETTAVASDATDTVGDDETEMHTPPGMNAADKAAYEAENQGEDKAKAQEALQEAEKQKAEEQEAAEKAADEAEKQEAEVQKAADKAADEAEKQEAEVQKAADKAADEAEKQEAEVQKAADKAADEAREWGAQEQTAADKAAFGSGAWAPGPHAKKADEAEKQAPEEKGYPKTKYSERWTPKMENEYLARKKQKAADKAADEKMSQNTQPTYGSRRL